MAGRSEGGGAKSSMYYSSQSAHSPSPARPDGLHSRPPAAAHRSLSAGAGWKSPDNEALRQDQHLKGTATLTGLAVWG